MAVRLQDYLHLRVLDNPLFPSDIPQVSRMMTQIFLEPAFFADRGVPADAVVGGVVLLVPCVSVLLSSLLFVVGSGPFCTLLVWYLMELLII